MTQVQQRVSENLARIRETVAASAVRGGREAEAIQLVAVVKYAPLEAVEALVAAGCLDLGESRPQQLWQRAEHFADKPVRWHFIGHLQRNKVRRTLGHVHLLHAGDSPRLLEAVNEAAQSLDQPASVLIEVNISGDANKQGFAPEDVEPLLPRLAELQHLRVRGLMAMASLHGGRDRARADFAALRKLRDGLRGNLPPGVELDELSMGMSDDFDIAIEEGATIVRVGSALLEGVEG
ncbi:MAG: YggS family pyridoxal phosphate-dependent enzyme [Pirellulaceae bacterium]